MFSGAPLTHALLDATGIGERLREICDTREPDVVFAYCSGMARFAMQPPLDRIPLVLDFVDVDSRKWRDMAEASAGPRSWIYRREAATLGAFEARAATRAAASLVVNEREAGNARALSASANVRVVDKVSWMNTTLQDGPWDMYAEDLLSLLTIDSNAYLSNSTSTWSHPRHNDKKVDEMYERYARETDPGKRKVIVKELLEYMTDKMYWNTISGSPFYMVAQPWVKNYTYNAEFEVHWNTVWLDR